jgi:hypothetical protein
LDRIRGIIICRIHDTFSHIKVCITKTHTAIVIVILVILALIVFVLIIVVVRLPLVLAKLGMVLLGDVAIVLEPS